MTNNTNYTIAYYDYIGNGETICNPILAVTEPNNEVRSAQILDGPGGSKINVKIPTNVESTQALLYTKVGQYRIWAEALIPHGFKIIYRLNQGDIKELWSSKEYTSQEFMLVINNDGSIELSTGKEKSDKEQLKK